MTDEDRSKKRSPGGPTMEQLEQATPALAGGREVRVGIFVLLGVVCTLLLLFILTDPGTFRGRYMVMTEVDDAGGIRQGDPVQMRGVNVGRVRDFQIRPPGVAITLEINGQWDIPRDSRTRLTGLGLLGGRILEIIPGDSEEALPPGGILPGESADGMMEVADALGDDAMAIARSMRNLLADTTVAQLQGSTAELERFMDLLRASVEEQRAELQRLSSTLSTSAARVDDALAAGDLERALARTDSTLAVLQETSGTLDRASRSLEVVLSRIEEGEGTLGRLSSDDELYRNLNEAARAILLLAEDVRANPSRYIRLRLF